MRSCGWFLSVVSLPCAFSQKCDLIVLTVLTIMYIVLKGVTAMTFPGTWAPPGSSQPGRNIPLQDEVAPANISIDLEKALVHFDLDPYNGMLVLSVSVREARLHALGY